MSGKLSTGKILLFLSFFIFTQISLKAQDQILENGTYFIKASNANLYLNVDLSTVNDDGASVHMQSYNNIYFNRNTKWQIERQSDGNYNICVLPSKKSLDAPAYEFGAVHQGAKMQIWQFNNSPNQHWRIENVGTDMYLLIVPNTKLCVQANSGNIVDLETYSDSQANNIGQVWIIKKSSLVQPGQKQDDNQ